MLIGEQVYHFTADRDRHGGAADLAYVGSFRLRRSEMLGGHPIGAHQLEFKAVHLPVVQADLLGVADAFSGLLVMSETMIDTVEQFGPAGLHTVPAVIQPDLQQRYRVVQVPILDIFDWEHSTYDPRAVRDLPGGARLVSTVERYAFTTEPERLPPVFSLTAQPTQHFIRADVRQALRDHGIRGVAFKRAAAFSATNQYVTDLPV